MIRISAMVLLLVLTSHAFGQVQVHGKKYLKKFDPNELTVWYFEDDDCPKDLYGEELVEYELSQARIQRLSTTPDEYRRRLIPITDLNLVIDIGCLRISKIAGIVYHIDVRFGHKERNFIAVELRESAFLYTLRENELPETRHDDSPETWHKRLEEFKKTNEKDVLSFGMMVYYSPYDTLGIAGDDREGRNFIRNSLRECVERALSDYLKVNFDL